jgi:hypothetical protein
LSFVVQTFYVHARKTAFDTIRYRRGNHHFMAAKIILVLN